MIENKHTETLEEIIEIYKKIERSEAENIESEE